MSTSISQKSNSSEDFKSDIESEFDCKQCITQPSNTCRTCWRKFCDKHIKRHTCVGFAGNMSSIRFPINCSDCYIQHDLWRFEKMVKIPPDTVLKK